MKTLALLAAAVLAAGLTACKDSPPGGDAAAKPEAAKAAVSLEAIAAEGKGFTVGSEMSVRRVYVFFDPQCPHCAALWQAAKPLKSQARFIWLPVSMLNASSAPQGATILAAPDPVTAMDAHEASLTAKQGGITAGSNIDAQKALVAANTTLFNRFAFGGVPVVVANHAQTGALVVKEGSMTTAQLAGVLGLAVPAGQ